MCSLWVLKRGRGKRGSRACVGGRAGAQKGWGGGWGLVLKTESEDAVVAAPRVVKSWKAAAGETKKGCTKWLQI